jgi:hypothetical protein
LIDSAIFAYRSVTHQSDPQKNTSPQFNSILEFPGLTITNFCYKIWAIFYF